MKLLFLSLLNDSVVCLFLCSGSDLTFSQGTSLVGPGSHVWNSVVLWAFTTEGGLVNMLERAW